MNNTSFDNLQGTFTALVTPFTADGSEIDEVQLQKLLERQLDSEVEGVVACGTTAETPTLSREEYKLVISTAVRKLSDKKPVIVGVGTNSTQATIENAKLAQAEGADGLLVVAPYYNKPNDAGMYEHFASVCNATDLPVIIYNVPGRTGKNIRNDITAKLAENHSNVVAVKEASGDMAQITELASMLPERVSILSGDDALTLPIISVGGRGCISVASNQIPTKFSAMVNNALSGDFASALKIHRQYYQLFTANFVESNPVPAKYILSKMGLANSSCRLPLGELSAENREYLDNLYTQLELS